jgi:hypothetical protein
VIELIAAPACAPFSIALLVMLGLTVLEMVTAVTGWSVNDLVDELVVSSVDTDAPTGMETTSGDAEGGTSVIGRFLAWLYVGRVPVLMLLIVFLTTFGLGGLVLQGVVWSVIGAPAPALLAVPVVLAAALPVVRVAAGVLARVLPRDETSAVRAETFVGRTALVVGGSALRGRPAQARLTDEFGTTHYVLVEPEEAGEQIASGEVVLLVRQTSGTTFGVIRNPSQALVDPS